MKGTVAFMIMIQWFYFLELTSIDYDPGLMAEPFYIKLSWWNQDFLAAAGYRFKA